MTDPGLNQRLRQRSRRAGFMIGISMALTIAVCVGGFSVIYAALDDTIADFVSRDVPDPVIPTAAPTQEEVAQANEPPATEDPAADQPEATEAPDAEPTSEGNEITEEFVADYQSSNESRLNFRSEPSTAGGESTIVMQLDEGTPLQYMGEDQPSEDPAVDGERWMMFRIEDGTEGWLREIDVTPLGD